jgi:hypothetical protein
LLLHGLKKGKCAKFKMVVHNGMTAGSMCASERVWMKTQAGQKHAATTKNLEQVAKKQLVVENSEKKY